ncbi:MAG: metal ABC transporter solute-binding protein, Zn/Mn family [Rhodothermaceae bacterium]
MNKFKNFIALLLISILVISCGTEKSSKNKVFVSILPQKHFVKAIAGDKFEIDVMVRPGLSPATYEPLPQQILALGESKLYFRIGVPFEKSWIDKIAANNKNLKIIDTRKNIELRSFETFEEMSEEGHNHDHSHHGHDHGAKDPHIWLDPHIVKTQAKTICEALVSIDQTNADFYKTNLEKFLLKLDTLDAELFNITLASENKKFLVFHPSWGYFADRYDLQQFSIEFEGKEPSPSQLTQIIDYLKKNDIKTIFVQKQFSTTSAETIAREINGNVKTLDPLSENYFENLIYMAKEIAGVKK